MSSYLGPVPNIPTLAPTNFYPEDQQPIHDQLAIVYTDIANVVNDKKRSDNYQLNLNFENVTNDVWVDGKPVFKKVLATGTLAAGANVIPHGITTLQTLVDIRVMVSNGTLQRPIPYASPVANAEASVDVNSTQVGINVGAAFGANFSGYIIMEYTKV